METKNISIKKGDLIDGEFYVIREFGDSKEIMKIIHKFDKFESTENKDKDRTKGYFLSNYNGRNTFHFALSTPWISGRFIRLATFEEKQWLETCISSNKFIPLNAINKKIRLWNLKIAHHEY